ncbi:D-lactaldehyde dehydrogenase [Mycena olivaceomarginata]|nr:D-lactaldehyde dehydrogenase [Mycena olivaceomarginata]
MPAVTSGKVLVSGANGFVAVWLVQTLLEHGYSVRGTVRSADKGKHLSKRFASYGDKFEIYVVPDITAEGAFDEAVKGVDAIEHTAAPFHFQADDPAEVLDPSIKGTVSILESARKYGTNVKRIVVTSSAAAMMNFGPNPQTLTEKDWNDQAVKELEELGRQASPRAKYMAAKTLGERAAWDFVKKHQSEIKWDVTTLCPPWVLGPVIHEISSPDALNTSCKSMYGIYTNPDAKANNGWWVDVRDLALAHVRSLQKEEAGGERIFISEGPFTWQDWLDAVPSPKYQKGTPGSGKSVVQLLSYENQKSIRILDLKYRPMPETAAAVIKDYEERGW